jgi:hypothetical protein
MPSQREIARRQAQIDTGLYIDLITWFARKSNHHAFKDVIPPEECPQPRLLEDK